MSSYFISQLSWFISQFSIFSLGVFSSGHKNAIEQITCDVLCKENIAYYTSHVSLLTRMHLLLHAWTGIAFYRLVHAWIQGGIEGEGNAPA